MKLAPWHYGAILAIISVVIATNLFGQSWNPIFTYLGIPVISFAAASLFLDKLIPRLNAIEMTGEDENKPGRPKVAEMGGLGIVAGFSAAALFGVSLSLMLPSFSLVHLLAAIITIHTIGFIGIGDDLFSLPQWFKAILPLFAAIPLIVVNAAGSTSVFFPFVGPVNFGVVYTLILIPLAIAVCSNLSNMLAGYNGMEGGMGVVMFATLSVLAFNHGSTEMLVISLAMMGALLGFLIFNWYPAKVFPGDVGNLSIGAVLATAVIIGNLESAGIILMVPYILDFFVKAANRFPHTHSDLKDGKMLPKDGRILGLVHLVMKAFGGISERGLVYFFIALEMCCAAVALALYLKP